MGRSRDRRRTQGSSSQPYRGTWMAWGSSTCLVEVEQRSSMEALWLPQPPGFHPQRVAKRCRNSGTARRHPDPTQRRALLHARCKEEVAGSIPVGSNWESPARGRFRGVGLLRPPSKPRFAMLASSAEASAGGSRSERGTLRFGRKDVARFETEL